MNGIPWEINISQGGPPAPPAVYIYIYMNGRPLIIAGGYISIYIYITPLILCYFTVVVLFFLHFFGKMC